MDQASATPAIIPQVSGIPIPAKMLTLRDVAELLGVSYHEVSRKVHAGELAVIRHGESGRSYRVTPEALQQYIQRAQAVLPSALPALPRAEKLPSLVPKTGTGIRRIYP